MRTARQLFKVYEGNYCYDTFEGALPEALEYARANVDRANYPDARGTIYVDVRVECALTGEVASATVVLDAPEPPCADGHDHDWQSLPGGVLGHGAGVIVREVCMHCGCARTTDTWATRPDTGTQGWRTVSYSPGEYADVLPESGADLPRAHLSAAILSGADLSGADLSGAYRGASGTIPGWRMSASGYLERES